MYLVVVSLLFVSHSLPPVLSLSFYIFSLICYHPYFIYLSISSFFFHDFLMRWLLVLKFQRLTFLGSEYFTYTNKSNKLISLFIFHHHRVSWVGHVNVCLSLCVCDTEQFSCSQTGKIFHRDNELFWQMSHQTQWIFVNFKNISDSQNPR